MPDNQLTHDELVRLECLSRVNTVGLSTEKVLQRASEFEKFVKGEQSV